MDSNYLDMLRCLNKAGVDYIMVGGWAVNLHGYVRATIDVINKIDGVSYADASPRAIPKTIEGIPVRIISREDLIANKRASGRTKDLADAEILEGLGK